MTQPPRAAIFTTTDGTHREAFAASHWGLAAFNALVFGSAFLWIALGLRSLTPSVIALARVALGAAALVWVSLGCSDSFFYPPAAPAPSPAPTQHAPY